MITLNEARSIITAAEAKAGELGQPMNVAVADGGGHLIAHVRMDGAWLGSVDISIKKAFTARAFDISTRDLAKLAQNGGDFFGINTSNEGRVMIFAGGIPLYREGRVCRRHRGERRLGCPGSGGRRSGRRVLRRTLGYLRETEPPVWLVDRLAIRAD
ncbi:uncharacterized protein GlcG (DUF336 family) [Mesorhizobium sp. USDA 4775]